jgi:prepilin-type N-terminal cleavage/methylation domain-containing protein
VFLKFLTFRRRHFTLIELLVVMAIIGILIGILLPAIQKVRSTASRAKSQSNIRQIMVAFTGFEGEHGYYPPACGWSPPTYAAGAGGIDGTAFFYILPYIEQSALWNKCSVTIGGGINYTAWENSPAFMAWDNGSPSSWTANWSQNEPPFITTVGYTCFKASNLYNANVPLYQGPADPNYQPNTSCFSYVVNAAVFVNNQTIGFAGVPDGLTNTIFVAEAYAGYAYSGTFSYGWSNYPNTSTGLFEFDIYQYREDYLYMTAENLTSYSYSYGGPGSYEYIKEKFSYASASFSLTPGKTFQPFGGTNDVYTDVPNSQGGYSETFSYGGGGGLPQANFSNGIIVGLGDASVRTVVNNVSYATWSAALTPAANDVVGSDW